MSCTMDDEEKMSSQTRTEKRKFTAEIQNYWNGRILENLTKANVVYVCCAAAGLLLVAYLAAFSCEVSWLLEAHGDLPTPAYLLCAAYFTMFVSATLLIHGLLTGLPWGLFCWSIIIGILSIPELAFVMMMTTQHWGLQSTHGLTELVSYLIRLIINCVTLLCVIPTALKWRREAKVLAQLQTLAIRLQLQTPPASAPLSRDCSQRSSRRRNRIRRPSAYDNPGFQHHENEIPNPIPFFGGFMSQNEFNASIFGLNSKQELANPQERMTMAKRAQSLVDLRYLLPGMYPYNTKTGRDEIDAKFINNNIERSKNINEKKTNIEDLSTIESISDPIYCTIEPKATKLSRNCVSLENLCGLAKLQNDLSYGNNLLKNYHLWPWYVHPMNYNHSRLRNVPIQYFSPASVAGCGGIGYGGFTNPYVNGSGTNSKQSLGNESDDYRKYRDVAL